MDWNKVKDFLKPTEKKIMIFLFLIIISLLNEFNCVGVLYYYCRGSMFPYAKRYMWDKTYELLFLQSALNIVIWYIVSCAVARIKSKKMIVVALIMLVVVMFYQWVVTYILFSIQNPPSRSKVILSISDTKCNETHMNIWVWNSGYEDSSKVKLYINGSLSTTTIISIKQGVVEQVSVSRQENGGWLKGGWYSLRAETTGSSARGSVYCPE